MLWFLIDLLCSPKQLQNIKRLNVAQFSQSDGGYRYIYIRQIDVNIMDKFAEKLDMIKKKYVPLIKFSIKKLEFPNFGNFTFFYSFILFINK